MLTDEDRRPRSEIFRGPALERYRRGRQKQVFPKWVSPRVVLSMWLILGLLGSAAFVVSRAEFPVLADALAFATGPAGGTAHGESTLLLLVEESASQDLQVGQPVFLFDGPGSKRTLAELSEVSGEVLSPATVFERFSLTRAVLPEVTGPRVVASAVVTSVGADLDIERNRGTLHRAQVEVGRRPLLELLLGPGSLAEPGQSAEPLKERP